VVTGRVACTAPSAFSPSGCSLCVSTERRAAPPAQVVRHDHALECALESLSWAPGLPQTIVRHVMSSEDARTVVTVTDDEVVCWDA
jgi:hydrogenase maturation factor